MKIGIMTDSSFYMSQDVLTKYEISQVGLSLNFTDETFVELDETRDINTLVYDKIKKDKVLPKSSQPSPQQFLDAFSKKVDQGFTRILFFCVSQKLSGTYQNAFNSARDFMEKNPSITIEVYDTAQFTVPAVGIVLQVAEYLSLKGDVSKEVIAEIIELYTSKSHAYFVVNDLTNLAYGGRISPSVAKFSNFVGLKPILCCKDGLIEPYSKARSKKAALKKMLADMQANLEPDCDYYIGVTHKSALEDATLLLDEAKKLLKDSSFKVIDMVELGPVMAIHCGDGAVLIHYCPIYKA